MEPREVSSSPPANIRVVTRDDIVSVGIIKSYDNNSWGFRRGGQITDIGYRGNRNGSWKRIWGIEGFFSSEDYHKCKWDRYLNL